MKDLINIEKEHALLGAILQDQSSGNSEVKKVSLIVSPDDFHDHYTRQVYGAMLDLMNRGHDIDVLTLTEKLSFPNAGCYVAELATLAPTSTHAATYAKGVKDLAVRREMVRKAEQDIREASNLKKSVDVNASRVFLTASDIADAAYLEAESTSQDDIISLGIQELDEATGGIFPTSLVIVAADTGGGKSEFIGNLAYEAAGDGKKVVYFDLENDESAIFRRQLCVLLSRRLGRKVSPKELRTNKFFEDANQETAFAQCSAILQERMGSMLMYDNHKLINVEDFTRFLDMIDDVDLVVIDHLHYFEFEHDTTENVAIGKIMRSFRMLQKKKRIPIVLASHLRKRAKKSDDPSIEDLHGSSNIGKECTTAILLNRRREWDDVRIVLAKNRDGEELGVWTAKYDLQFRRYTNLDRDDFGVEDEEKDMF